MSDPQLLPETESRSAFAARLGCKPGYVTELAKGGRLVLGANGRDVRVAESLKLIADTRDPSKAGVAARHAATREQSMESVAESSSSPAEGMDADDDAESVPASYDDPHALRRARALADKEEALARKALREEQVEMGELLRRDATVAFVADAITQLRSRMELLPSTLAPELAADPDEDSVRAKLRDTIERSLEELARKFASIGRTET